MFVSIRPRVGSPVTVKRILVDGAVEVGAQPMGVDHRGRGKRSHHLLARNVGAPPQRDQPTDRCPVPGNRVGLAALNPAHDRSRVVAQLALSDLVTHRINHELSLARRATTYYRMRQPFERLWKVNAARLPQDIHRPAGYLRARSTRALLRDLPEEFGRQEPAAPS